MRASLPTRNTIKVTFNYHKWRDTETAHINPLQLNKSAMHVRELRAFHSSFFQEMLQPCCYRTSVARKNPNLLNI